MFFSPGVCVAFAWIPACAPLKLAGAMSDSDSSASIGTFATKEQAAHAYDQAVRKQGKAGALNFASAETGAEAAKQAAAKHAREATLARPRSASGLYGVSAKGKRWEAYISYGGKKHHIGSFSTKEQAAHAHDGAAKKHKKGAALNFASAATGAATEAAERSRRESRKDAL
jgi:hypothetical protein